MPCQERPKKRCYRFNSIINEIIRSEIDIIYTNAFGGIIRNKNYTISFGYDILRLLYAFIVTYSFCRWAIALTFAFQRIN
ncbi:hypothetical protein D0V76_18300 [Salmonella enterica]|uniref:Uncharacterized protein n=3 Tax=Salmonella enterica TaxID=28901 RepID=A0A602YY19_SALET|nr:hypothetical protein [Salmonella enterica subsp. enterica serovar Pensacola]EBI6371795.1 hypothetical protein [Salmonella enterica]EBI6681048.1 hypothetical protein [Salmonella enterica]EBJ3195852.1 hypothetical protein [Salmonella enterica]EBJ5131628.1 hypothetical protein [Salmonella enterica]